MQTVRLFVWLLQKHGVEYNLLTTVNRINADYPLEAYRFLRDEVGTEWIQLIPIVERRDSDGLGLRLEGTDVTDRSVRPEQFGRFMTTVFDEWVRNDVGRVCVQTFEAAVRNWMGLASSGMCVFNENCGNALAVEHNGDVYSCDHYRRGQGAPQLAVPLRQRPQDQTLPRRNAHDRPTPADHLPGLRRRTQTTSHRHRASPCGSDVLGRGTAPGELRSRRPRPRWSG